MNWWNGPVDPHSALWFSLPAFVWQRLGQSLQAVAGLFVLFDVIGVAWLESLGKVMGEGEPHAPPQFPLKQINWRSKRFYIYPLFIYFVIAFVIVAFVFINAQRGQTEWVFPTFMEFLTLAKQVLLTAIPLALIFCAVMILFAVAMLIAFYVGDRMTARVPYFLGWALDTKRIDKTLKLISVGIFICGVIIQLCVS